MREREPEKPKRQNIMEELARLGVTEPTEEERFIRREDAKTWRMLRMWDRKDKTKGGA